MALSCKGQNLLEPRRVRVRVNPIDLSIDIDMDMDMDMDRDRDMGERAPHRVVFSGTGASLLVKIGIRFFLLVTTCCL